MWIRLRNGRSLWSILVDGSDPHRLVAGTSYGDWQASSPAHWDRRYGITSQTHGSPVPISLA
jgi:hypothetical protein